MDTPKFGTNLPNGAIVVDVRGKYILAFNNTGGRDEFVVWQWDRKNLNTTVYGHYYQQIEHAAADFAERAARG
jgi:hypothetical protein